LYADAYVNAVFLLLGKRKEAVGAELRGTSRRPWRGMTSGSNKDGGYFSIHPTGAEVIVLCESAIDALSCFVLHLRTLLHLDIRSQAQPSLAPFSYPKRLSNRLRFRRGLNRG
jgi:hypothetical protein